MFSLHILIILISCELLDSLLLFPASSVYQITYTLSVPVLDLQPPRRLGFDWGLQMNYNFPFDVASFYNVPIWPEIFGNQLTKRQAKKSKFTHKNSTTNRRHYQHDGAAHGYHWMTANQIYKVLEQLFVSNGFQATCLLRSVCELAQHPFDDQHRNILTDILTFLLTPSLHKGFDATDRVYRETYENAELRGFLGVNCSDLYSDCMLDFLNIITKVISSNG